jgi:hypothetical protein
MAGGPREGLGFGFGFGDYCARGWGSCWGRKVWRREREMGNSVLAFWRENETNQRRAVSSLLRAAPGEVACHFRGGHPVQQFFF